jgi:hypothetical protein
MQQVRVVKARQQTGFLNEAVQACGKRFAKALAAQHKVMSSPRTASEEA